jgi:hypothetical protein
MAKLTLAIDGDVLDRARMRALERHTSVNQLVRDYLESLAGVDRTKDAVDAFIGLAEHIGAGSGPKGRTWTREDLYER